MSSPQKSVKLIFDIFRAAMANKTLKDAISKKEGQRTAFGNDPAIGRAQTAGFRMRAPRRGQTKIPGIGRVRSAVERGHALLCQS